MTQREKFVLMLLVIAACLVSWLLGFTMGAKP